MESVDLEWDWSEDFAVVVDAAVEHEAVFGMVGVAIIEMKAELSSLLRRVQGVDACNHASMTKVDRRLQELEAVHSKKNSDSAGTATSQLSVQKSIDRKGDIDREEAGCKGTLPVEQADGADQRELKRPSELTDGASQSMGWGGGTSQRRWEKKGGAYNDWVEQADGVNQRDRDRPTEFADELRLQCGHGCNGLWL